MNPSLLIFDSHPVQYRAPLYAKLNHICPGKFHVVYASDFSLRGGHDPGFSSSITWDSDLLAGYPSTILNTNRDRAPQRWSDLNGRGLGDIFRHSRPRSILLTSLNYQFDYAAYLNAICRGIPIWLRYETQDNAFIRSSLKAMMRSSFYKLAYRGVSRAFPIGVLNREHYLHHGLRSNQLLSAHYCTPDRASVLSGFERQERRERLRATLGIRSDQLVISFFGKLIPKKDPEILLRSVAHLDPELRARVAVIYVGSGELHDFLQQRSKLVEEVFGVSAIFAGFVNQSQLADWYLASDVVVLPSNRQGETWGLVVNEAMQAGCSVVVSEAVGCAADFGEWERVRVIPVGNAFHLASALQDLSAYSRSFDWAAELLKGYSVEAAAGAIASLINQ